MRIGPLVRRSACALRAAKGAASPQGRPGWSPAAQRLRAEYREPLRAGGVEFSAAPALSLETPLPINLRHFLEDHLSAAARIQPWSITAAAAGNGATLVSEVARALRRFSIERSRERWVECAVGLAELRRELQAARDGRGGAVLCLSCAVVSVGAEAAASHRANRCVVVRLEGARATWAAARDRTAMLGWMLGVIEEFRLARARLGLSHFDLDCYVAKTQAIFTWRPPASGSEPPAPVEPAG